MSNLKEISRFAQSFVTYNNSQSIRTVVVPDCSHLDYAPLRAPLKHGDRETVSRLARQKWQQRKMNQRAIGMFCCIGALLFLAYLIGW